MDSPDPQKNTRLMPGEKLPDSWWTDPATGRRHRVVDLELIERPVEESPEARRERVKAGLPAQMVSYVAGRIER